MSDIQPYIPSQPGSRLPRRTVRDLNQIQQGSVLGLARVEQTAYLQAARVEAVALVARTALNHAMLLSQTEQSLAQSCPAASGRLATIADLAAIALAEVVVDTTSRVRRA